MEHTHLCVALVVYFVKNVVEVLADFGKKSFCEETAQIFSLFHNLDHPIHLLPKNCRFGDSADPHFQTNCGSYPAASLDLSPTS